LHVCPLQYSSRTLPATQSKPGLLADKLSEVQMSYFFLCLCVCQYLWIIKFLEWAYRKKMGDMRGYFHRLGYWGFIIRLILLRFSFVFLIHLPIRKSNRMILSFRFWALVDYISVMSTGTCFIQKIYAPSSSLLQGRPLPFTPSPLRLNIFRLFVILSLTQL
jgi:hypothetical protein